MWLSMRCLRNISVWRKVWCRCSGFVTHLSNVLNVGTTQGQFLTAGVTFCGLRPMRSVNARVICLIGMNEGVFPVTPRNRVSIFPVSEER